MTAVYQSNQSLFSNQQPKPKKPMKLELSNSKLKKIQLSPMLKLASPEFEKYLQEKGLSTSYLILNTPTEEQQEFSQGFEAALKQMYADRGQPKFIPTPKQERKLIMSSSNSLNTMIPTSVSEQPKSPVNMETQEVMKIEHKRERNRVAARKCRYRKLERIENLENKVNGLKKQNQDLDTIKKDLKSTVEMLKAQIKLHIKSGCSMAVSEKLLL